jgi:hypothetical protein
MEMIKMATYEETKEALEGAIKKWELIYANAGTDEGTDNCPLCELFNYGECTGCPVDYVTNEGCSGGPYSDWYWHHRYSHDSTKHPLTIECAKCTEIALDMINYLKSLRPVVDEMFDKNDKRKVRPDTSDIPEF